MKREELKPKITVSAANCGLLKRVSVCDPGTSQLEHGIREGENPVPGWEFVMFEPFSKSRVAWECSPKGVVNFI